jgi:O-antigen ligase
LCTAFVLFLLWLERRTSRGVSGALWIPTLWMLMIGSRSLDSWFSLGVIGGNDSGGVLDRWVLMGLTVAAVVVVAHRNFDWSGTLRQHKWLLVLLLYMLASTLWSDIPLITFRRWAREAIVLPMALLIMSEADPRQALASLFRRSAYVLIPFSVVLIKYYATLGRDYGRWFGEVSWIGVTTQKNQLGRLCTISIFFLLWMLYRGGSESPPRGRRYQGWAADVFIVVIGLYLLKGANSSTSMATLLVGATTFLVLHLFRKLNVMVRRTGLLAFLTILAVFGAAAPFQGGSNVAIFSASLNRDSTLTGRTEIWSAVLPAMKQRALLGYGFGSFWTDARRKLYYHMPSAHNGYLDILLELGVVGLAFYAIWLLSCTRQLHRALAWDYEWASIAICFLVMTLIYNTTESSLNSMVENMSVVLVFASLVASCGPATAKLSNDVGVMSGYCYNADYFDISTTST